MKKIIIATAAIAAALSMASCNKELVEPEKNTTVGESVITASIENDLTKTSLEGNDDDGYKVFWLEGDNLFVSDAFFESWAAKYTLDKPSAGSSNGIFSWQKGDTFIAIDGSCNEPTYQMMDRYVAMYPYDIVDLNNDYNIIWKTEQTYSMAGKYIPMFCNVECTKDGTADFKFYNLGGILRLTIKGSAKIESIRIDANEVLSGVVKYICEEDEDVNIAYMGEASDNNKKYIELNCEDGVLLSEVGTDFYISMPCNYNRFDNITYGYTGVTITLTDTEGKTCVKKLSSDKKLVIERSKITTASFTASEFKANIPEGALPGKFSVSADKQVYFSKGNLYYDGSDYLFEAYQYDFHGYDSENNTWGLFGWSTAATTYGMSTSDDPDDYSGSFVDWGKAIDNKDTWRTLSRDEWWFLLDYRYRNGGPSYSANITYGGKMGLVLYPDDYDKEPISGTVTKLPEGVVFLPAAGSRLGSEMIEIGARGNYWSSSELDETYACFMSFGSDDAGGNNNWYRSDGYSVRLVTDCE